MDCKVSALLLALWIVTNNEELTKKLIEFAEEARRYDISIDYQKLEADNSWIKQSADYTLKKQSAEMKFRALIFWSVLNWTEQWDEALKELWVEMAKSWDVIAEWLQLVELIDWMSLSNINELASIYFKWDIDKAKESLEALRWRINMYTASQYSAINSNVKRKVDDRVKAITKELDDARAFLSKEQYEFDRAMETLNYSEENLKKDKRRKNANIVTEAKKDLEILNKPSPKSWPEKKEYDKQLNKISKKYWFNQANWKRATKDNMIKKLNSILEADEIVKKWVDKTKVDILLKESEDALRWDLKLIKDWQNPYELVDLDREWKFAKDFDGSVEWLTKEYGYYAMAKAMLWDSQWNIPQNVYDAIKKIVSENKSMPDTVKWLTSDWILDEWRTLEELLWAAYIHTKELINNEELRNLWRQQILAKTSDDVLTQTDVAEIESILNAVRLSEWWANFSTVFWNISLAQTARALWIEVKNEEWWDLKKWIIKLMSDNDFETALKHVDQFKVSVWHKSVEIYKQDLLALVADILHIDNFYKAILNNDSVDKDLIRIAWMYLSWKSDLANSNLKALMNAAREAAPKSDDSKWLLLTAITGKNVNKDTKIAFFDIKKENKYTAWTSARRDFMNKITEINSLTVTDKIDVMEWWYEEMLSKLQRDFADWWYIIVNDSTWKNNSDLNRAIEKANEWKDYSKKVKVIYSRWGMMSSLNMVNWKLVFSMTDKSEFDKFVRTQAIAALGNWLEKDDVVKELMQKAVNWNIDDIKKYNDELEKVARNYFSEMFWVPNDDELFAVIEWATWMSFKDYSSIENKVDFWTKVDAVTTLWMKVSGNITNEVVKVADFVRSLRELEPEDVLARINRMFGSDFTVDDITDERWVTDTIMDLFIRYNLSQDFTQLLENKWRLFAALNWASWDVLDMAQIKQAFQSWDFSIYKQVFNLDDEALAKYQKQINDILFEWISQQLADNLIAMGYTIPHARIQEVVLDWLNGKVNVNSEFAKKFLFRNNVWDSRDVYEAIIREAMPTEFNFKWDDFWEWDRYQMVNQGWWHYHTEQDFSFVGSWEWTAVWGFWWYVAVNPLRAENYAYIASHWWYKRSWKRWWAKGTTQAVTQVEIPWYDRIAAQLNSFIKALEAWDTKRLFPWLRDNFVDVSVDDIKWLPWYFSVDFRGMPLIEHLFHRRQSWAAYILSNIWMYAKVEWWKAYVLADKITRKLEKEWLLDEISILNDFFKQADWKEPKEFIDIASDFRNNLPWEAETNAAYVIMDNIELIDWKIKVNLDDAIDEAHSKRISEELIQELYNLLDWFEVEQLDEWAWGYFYRIDIPDNIRAWYNTPTWWNYLEERRAMSQEWIDAINDAFWNKFWKFNTEINLSKKTHDELKNKVINIRDELDDYYKSDAYYSAIRMLKENYRLNDEEARAMYYIATDDRYYKKKMKLDDELIIYLEEDWMYDVNGITDEVQAIIDDLSPKNDALVTISNVYDNYELLWRKDDLEYLIDELDIDLLDDDYITKDIKYYFNHPEEAMELIYNDRVAGVHRIKNWRDWWSEWMMYNLVTAMLWTMWVAAPKEWAKMASNFFSDLWYKWLHYDWNLDWECYVIYKEWDMKTVWIIDNKSWTPLYINENYKIDNKLTINDWTKNIIVERVSKITGWNREEILNKLNDIISKIEWTPSEFIQKVWKLRKEWDEQIVAIVDILENTPSIYAIPAEDNLWKIKTQETTKPYYRQTDIALSNLVDSNWNQLTVSQGRFFKNSAVRDDNWNLLVVYHWTKVKWLNTFDYAYAKWQAFWPWFYFTPDKWYAREYAENSQWRFWWVKEVYINIENPIRWKENLTDSIKATLQNLIDRWVIKEDEATKSLINSKRDYIWVAWIKRVSDTLTAVYWNDVLEPLLRTFRNISWYDWIIANHYVVFTPEQIKNVDNLNPSMYWTDTRFRTIWEWWRNVRWVVEDWNYVWTDIQLALKDFKNWRTSEELLKHYWIVVKKDADWFIDKLVKVQWWLDAAWVTVSMQWKSDIINAIIYLRKNIAEWTVQHELFHWVMNSIAPSEKAHFIDEAKRLYWYDNVQAEEMLADLFSEYYRTWKFSLPKQNKEFTSWIKQWFAKVKEWLEWVNKYEEEVRNLYNDILDYKLSTRKTTNINWNEDWYINRLVESENPFVQSSYSTLVSLSAIKNNEVLPWVWHEKERLISILQDYRSKVEAAIEKWNWQISFSDAQKLKQQVWYALDMFEQDYLSPKYSKLFTPQERTELFWLKYGLWIATNKDELWILEEYNEKIINRYDNSISWMNNKNKEYLNWLLKWKAKNKENDIDARQEQLIEKGYTMANVNWELIVVDLKQELLKQIKTIPDNVKWLESLKTLWEAWLEQFSNREAYMLLNVVELAKNADNKMNMMVQTLYQYSPILKQYDFFNRFKVNRDWVPEVMRHNSLTTDFLLKYQNTAQFDTNNKKSILSWIRSKIINKWKIEVDELNKIIDDAIKTNLSDIHWTINPEDIDRFKKETAMVYASLFNPYTYLRDIPKNVKKFMDWILNEQQRWLRDALSKIDQTSELNRIIDNVNIFTNDWDLISLREILDWRENNVLKNVLDTEDEVLKDASDLAKEQSVKWESETTRLKREKSNEIEATKIENNFKEALSAYLNESQKVADSEKKIRQRIMGTARTVLQQYSTTNLFSELDYSLSTKNDKVSLMLKNEILWFIWNLTWNKVWKFLFWNYIKENIKIRFEKFKQVYMNIYNLSNAQLKAFKPKWSLENAAYNTVLYFKEIEHKLWSADGFRWVSLDQNINKAFYNIWEVVWNISPTRWEITDEDLAWIYSLISWIQNNSFLKFFIFANPNDLAYVRQFSDRWLIDSVWFTWYRKYVSQKDVNANREWFNTTFWTQMSETDFRIVMQWLSWYWILSDNAWIALLQRLINWISVSNFVDRAFTSRPWQLFTVRSQWIAYWLKQKFWEEDLWIEDMKKVNEIRKSMWILDNELTELRPFDEEWRNSLFHWVNSNDELAYYNRYWIPNVDDVYDKVKLYTTEDLDSLYSKVNDYYSNEWVNINSILGLVDAYKDNANNLMDWLFNWQFKNISFVRALQTNNYIKFYTAEEFDNWLKNPNVSADMKNKAIEKIQADAGRHYKNILWLGFSWMDRWIWFAWWRISWVYQALVNLVSFRWAWWRTIANQVLDILETWWNAKAWLTQEWRDWLVRYLANQPEFLNFSKAIFNDIVNCWHLTRILDNWDFDPTEDETYNLMDLASYIEHVVDTIPEWLDVVSQWWQGLQSAWNTRIVWNWIASLYRWVNEDDYKDVMGIWALFNSINREFGRNWKFRNWAMWVIFKANSFEEWVEWLWNEWRKLSFWWMRYMFNTDEWAYGYSTEFIRDDSWIPSILTWQPWRWWDRTFQNEELNYTKTYMTLSSLVTSLSDTTEWVTKWYLTDLWNIMWNNSPFFWLIRNTYRLFWWNIWDLYTWEDWWQYVYTTKAWKALIDNGYYVPTEKDEIDIVLDEFLSKYRPGNESFNTSMFNFDKWDHMASTTESNYSDAEMEELLTNIKYKRNDAFEFELDDKWNKIVTDEWKRHMELMEQNYNYDDYLTVSNYNFIRNWVEENNSDPNYIKYNKLIAEWMLQRELTDKLTYIYNNENKERWLKWTDKATLTNIRNALWDKIYNVMYHTSEITWNTEPMIEVILSIDKIARDKSYIRMIEKELTEKWNRKEFEKYFYTDKDWNIQLWNKTKSWLEEQIKLADALEKWDLNRFRAETASITNIIKWNDPYWIVTLETMDSILNRINTSNKTAEEKLAAFDAILEDNVEFLQQHLPLLVKKYWTDVWSSMLWYANSLVYNIDKAWTNLVVQAEDEWSKKWISTWKWVSIKTKWLYNSLWWSNWQWWSWNWWTTPKTYTFKVTPVELNWSKLLEITWGKGYTPKTYSMWDYVTQYKPHSNFEISKDVSRWVKKTSSQAVSTKKQLSNIEAKTEKALTAEA